MSNKVDSNRPSLPRELLPLILDSASSFADVEALILTSPILYYHWKKHAKRISSAVTERFFLCYHEAQMLASDQETREERSLEDYPRQIHHNKRLIRNAKVASQVCELFVQAFRAQVPPQGFYKPDTPCPHTRLPHLSQLAMTETGRRRFFAAFYTTWRWSGLLVNTSRPGDFNFDQLPFGAYFPMVQLADWSHRLNYHYTRQLYALLRPTTNIEDSLNSTLEHLDVDDSIDNYVFERHHHPWLKVCRCITRRKRTACGTGCWQSFFEECQLHSENSQFFTWPPSLTRV